MDGVLLRYLGVTITVSWLTVGRLADGRRRLTVGGIRCGMGVSVNQRQHTRLECYNPPFPLFEVADRFFYLVYEYESRMRRTHRVCYLNVVISMADIRLMVVAVLYRFLQRG